MASNSIQTAGTSHIVELQTQGATGGTAYDPILFSALHNAGLTVKATAVADPDNNANFNFTENTIAISGASKDNLKTFLEALVGGNSGPDSFDNSTDSRYFIQANKHTEFFAALQTYLRNNTDEFQIDTTASVAGEDNVTISSQTDDSSFVMNFFENLRVDDSIYGTVFDLNSMSEMSRVPADNYAIALENLRAIGSNSSMGIAELTQATTDVQVESGKLEMINGVVKNAVNYLNTRARALTS